MKVNWHFIIIAVVVVLVACVGVFLWKKKGSSHGNASKPETPGKEKE